MRRTVVIWVLILGFGMATAFHVHAATLTATGDMPELISGENLLAIGLYEDAPGSSDAT